MNNPRATILWPGAILGTVVKSIATAIYAELDSLQSWSANNYIVQGWDGRYGAVTFDGPQGQHFHAKESAIVGAFYSNNSLRCPDVGKNQTAMEEIFRGCPERHRQLAEKGALQFLLFEAHPGGPCTTAAFWNNGDALEGAEPWVAVLKNGAELLGAALVEDVEEALLGWNKQFHLSEKQLELARSIYTRKLSDPCKEIVLTEAEAAFLANHSDDPNAMKNCKTSFGDIRVIIP